MTPRLTGADTSDRYCWLLTRHTYAVEPCTTTTDINVLAEILIASQASSEMLPVTFWLLDPFFSLMSAQRTLNLARLQRIFFNPSQFSPSLLDTMFSGHEIATTPHLQDSTVCGGRVV